MDKIILTRPDPIEALSSPEAVVENKTSENFAVIKEEKHDSKNKEWRAFKIHCTP